MEQPANRPDVANRVRRANTVPIVWRALAGHHREGAVSRELLALRQLRRSVERFAPDREQPAIAKPIDGAILVVARPRGAGRRA